MARPIQTVNLAGSQPSDQTRYNQAQAMQNEGMTPIQISSYKGITAAPSPAEGLAKALMAYTGAKRMRELDAARSPMPTAMPKPAPAARPGGMAGMMSKFSSAFR